MKSNFKFITVALLIFVFSASCTNKESPGRLLESQLLSRLPSNTVGFLIRNFDSKQSKLFKETAWGKASGDTSQVFESLFGSNSEVLKNLNTNQSIENELSKAKEVLVCLTEENSKFPIAIGSLVRTQDKSSASEVIKIVKEALKSKGNKVEQIELAKGSGFKVSLKDTKVEIFLTSKDSLASLGTNKELIEKLMQPETKSNSTIQTIKNSDNFKRALAKVKLNDKSLTFSYGEIKKLVDILNKSDLKQAKKMGLDSFPESSIIYTRSFDTGINDHAVIVSDKAFKSPDGKSLQSLASTGALLEKAAKESISYLSISGYLLNSLIAELEKQGQAPSLPPEVKQLKSIGLGASASSGQSVFPDIYGVIETDNVDSLSGLIKNSLVGAVQQQALPTSQWSTKDIQGVKTEYMLSMLGIGVYLAPADKYLILGSSESAITAAISTIKNKSNSLASNLSAEAKTVAQSNNGLAAVFFDFVSLTETIKSLQGSMAMFSGGKAPAIKELEELAKYGQLTVNASVEETAIDIRSRIDLPEENA